MKPGTTIPLLLAFAGAFSAGLALSGCIYDDCDCPDTSQDPEEQVLSMTGGVDFGEDGNQSIVPVDLAGGTMSVESDQLILEYTEEGNAYRVTYVRD